MNYRIGYVAEKLGVDIQALRNWVKAGQVPCSMRTPGGRYLFSENDIEQIDKTLKQILTGDNND